MVDIFGQHISLGMIYEPVIKSSLKPVCENSRHNISLENFMPS